MTKYVLHTSKPVAVDSPDHLAPRDTMKDNSRNLIFCRKLFALYGGRTIRVLDLGCAGGGFVHDCLEMGHSAVGLEGSDYSKIHRRAEWAVIPDHLFTCDITAEFTLNTIDDSGVESPARFDVITGWEFLEHIRIEDLSAVFSNVRRHLAPGGICIFSIADFADAVLGVNYHQTVQNRSWWIDYLHLLNFRDRPELINYFDVDWVRGPLQGSESFHVVLTNGDDAAPAPPAARPYTRDDLITAARFFLQQGLDQHSEGAKSLTYAVRCIDEAAHTAPSEDLCHYRSIALLGLGRRDEAGDSARKALELKPDHPHAWRVLNYLTLWSNEPPRLPSPRLVKRAAGLEPPPDRLLSLLVGGRNDSYMGDFKWRLTTCLNYLAHTLSIIGRTDDVEMLICDWNSDKPLSHDLPLTAEAQRIVRFVVVPPDLARMVQLDSTFPIPVVQNAAIRRSRGHFIAQTDADILFTPFAMRSLLDVLEGRVECIDLNGTLMVASRRHLPHQQLKRKPSVRELASYLARNASLLPHEALFPGLATPSALAVLHRNLWQEVRGYDERFINWGWMEIDLYLRLLQKHPWLDLANFGVDLIHMEHYIGPLGRAEGTSRKPNPMPTPTTFVAGGSDWGLAEYELKIEASANLVVDSPQPEGLIEPWSISPRHILGDLANPIVQETVNEVLNPLQIGHEEVRALMALAWYARTRYPRNYLEIGIRRGHAAAIVARGCPGVEIYGVDTWQNDSFGESKPPHYAGAVLTSLGKHTTFAQFVSGDPQTAVQRLMASPRAPRSFDLAYCRAHPAFGDPIRQACKVLSHIGRGGAMILTSGDASVFAAVWDELRQRYPSHYYLKFQGPESTGIVLAASLKE